MWPLHSQSYCNISMKNGSNVILTWWVFVFIVISPTRKNAATKTLRMILQTTKNLCNFKDIYGNWPLRINATSLLSVELFLHNQRTAFTFHNSYVILKLVPITVIFWTDLSCRRKGSNKAVLLLCWSYSQKHYTVVITIWLAAT